MTFRESLKRKLCWLWWKLRNDVPSAPLNVTSNGLRPHHLVLVLPPEFHDFDIARHAIEPLMSRTQPRQATIVLRENFRTWIGREVSAKILTFDPAKKDFLGLPANGICDKTRELGADVTIDLTPGFSPYTAALTAASQAPLRISMERDHGYNFYNFYVHEAQDKTLAERYQMLLRYV
jgi:hypothetical protein